ncbi:MAG: LacI family transcriptional regulator [Opitutaceae bacterium]|jgi:LacI family transcriptional regulator|nr:LacI family transcriptional regulator [Opitutaceae bacterium]
MQRTRKNLRPLSRPATRPTLKTIADELGVTPMTVSKSLRGIGRISDETRRRVRGKAEELGYLSSRERLFPPFVKRARGGEHRLRLLCPTISVPDRGESAFYRNDMVSGLERALASTGGEVLAESFTTLSEMLEFLGNSSRIHGIILSEPYPTRWVDALRTVAPVIYTVGHDFQRGVNSVFFNEARAAALAADRLHAAGHRQIGWLGIFDRHASFLVPDEEFDKEHSADWLAHSGHGTRYASWLYLACGHGGVTNWPVSLVERDWRSCPLSEAVRRGCREILNTRPRPTAIVCVANAIARELIAQLESAGLRIPDDMSVISYGVEERGNTNDGHLLTGLLMPMDKVGGLVPEVVQRCQAYPDGLPISIQFDAEWSEGETLRHVSATRDTPWSAPAGPA